MSCLVYPQVAENRYSTLRPLTPAHAPGLVNTSPHQFGKRLPTRAKWVHLWKQVGESGARWGNRTMLLTGTHERTLDDKKRMALPKRVRELLQEPTTLFVTPGPDQS